MDQAEYKAPDKEQALKHNVATKAAEAARAAEKAPAKAKEQFKPTPMMAQFLEIKAVNPDYLLFYRMGDFYELFFEDAEIASKALGIVLTKRGKYLDKDIPMCGVPIHAAQTYLKKLISLGHKVAICEQLEDPLEAKKRGAKSVVKRDVVRLVSAGTITEDELLPSNNNNFLCAISFIEHENLQYALAWADISTGEIFFTQIDEQQIIDEISLIDPSEIIISQKNLAKMQQKSVFPNDYLNKTTIIKDDNFASEGANIKLKQNFADFNIDNISRPPLSALNALISYINFTQKNATISLRKPIRKNINSLMSIDEASRNSLELLTNNQGEIKGSLRDNIDLCLTPAGSRLLARRITAPLTNKERINERLDMVESLFSDNIYREELRKNIRSFPDIARALTRLWLDRSGPRDLANIGQAIMRAIIIKKLLLQKDNLPKALNNIIANLEKLPSSLGEKLHKAFIDEPPVKKADGGFIRQSFSAELDRQRRLASESRTIISALQQELSQECQIKNLKIKHNRVLGYFVEVPIAHGNKLLGEQFGQKFIHRQTMANAMRFTTKKLAQLESEIFLAQAKALEIELEIFASLKQEILQNSAILQQAADSLAKLDLALALAELAARRNFCRPKIDDSLCFNIEGGRHPVVEETLKREGKNFVMNDCNLSGENEEEGGQLWLITGPNMGGKSTFLRQNALIAILAQMGSFVPANSAHIGIVDRVFSRVGASDDIARGRSTFMVEMVETATILNNASNKSLVILDEIGRGTSTFDGLSIAWATAEFLNKINRSRALFATHFHELTSLANNLDRASNHTMKVREYKGEVIFLHEVVRGAADRSYGIQVAKLAGLAEPVIKRAREVLDLLEKHPSNNHHAILDDLPLFSSVIKEKEKIYDPVKEMLDELNPDELTPLKAIEFLYQLKKLHDG